MNEKDRSTTLKREIMRKVSEGPERGMFALAVNDMSFSQDMSLNIRLSNPRQGYDMTNSHLINLSGING